MKERHTRATCRSVAAGVILVGFAVLVTASVVVGDPARHARTRDQGRRCGYDPEGDELRGWCRHAEVCNHLGVCVSGSCAKDCAGRACGLDPVCGFSCGTCGSGLDCSPAGECVRIAPEEGKADGMRSESVGRGNQLEVASSRGRGDGRRGEP